MEVIWRGGTAPGAVVYQDEFWGHVAGEFESGIEVSFYLLGHMLPMGDDEMKVEDGRDVAEDKVVLSEWQAFFFSVEILGAEKARSIGNRDRVDPGRHASDSVGRILAEDPAISEPNLSDLSLFHGIMATSKLRPVLPLLFIERLESR